MAAGEVGRRRLTAARFGVRAVLATLALVAAAVPFGLLVVLVEDRWSPLWRVDAGARDDLHTYAVRHAGFVSLMQGLSDAGSTLAWVVLIAALVAWLLWRRRFRAATFAVVTVAGGSLVNLAVKTAVHRARPVLVDPVSRATGLSFPSGHAQAAMVGYAVLLLALHPHLRGAWRHASVAGAVLMVLAIGASRVALGVHYVSDVAGGYLLGLAWVAAMTAAFRTWSAERGGARGDGT